MGGKRGRGRRRRGGEVGGKRGRGRRRRGGEVGGGGEGEGREGERFQSDVCMYVKLKQSL